MCDRSRKNADLMNRCPMPHSGEPDIRFGDSLRAPICDAGLPFDGRAEVESNPQIIPGR
jgi:hypothetical protein